MHSFFPGGEEESWLVETATIADATGRVCVSVCVCVCVCSACIILPCTDRVSGTDTRPCKQRRLTNWFYSDRKTLTNCPTCLKKQFTQKCHSKCCFVCVCVCVWLENENPDHFFQYNESEERLGAAMLKKNSINAS